MFRNKHHIMYLLIYRVGEQKQEIKFLLRLIIYYTYLSGVHQAHFSFIKLQKKQEKNSKSTYILCRALHASRGNRLCKSVKILSFQAIGCSQHRTIRAYKITCARADNLMKQKIIVHDTGRRKETPVHELNLACTWRLLDF